MGDLTLEVRGQVDNCNSAKWALFRTNTATNAETLGDEGEPGVGRDFDAELSGAHDLLYPWSAAVEDGG